jgi:hypothetical protein
MIYARGVLLGLATVLFLAAPAFAQQTPASPPSDSNSDQNADAQKKGSTTNQSNSDKQLPAKPESKYQTTNDRVFMVMPNYLTVENASSAPRLSAGEKFKYATLDTFDYFVYPYIGAQAAIAQAQNSPKEYKQGWEAYGLRYGQAFGDNGIGNYMTEAVFPIFLHQDPRYYQLGHGGFWHRTYYALSRVVITRGDSGNAEINFSEICGNAANAAISRSYHVDSERNAGDATITWWTQIGWDAAANFSKEFWPDIHRWMRGEKSESTEKPN